MYIEKQKNRVYIKLPNLEDLSEINNRNTISQIAGLFNNLNFVKFICGNIIIKNEINRILSDKDILEVKDKRNIVLFFEVENNKLVNLLKILDLYNDAELEIFTFTKKISLLEFSQKNENEANSCLYISDNDGPSLTFDMKKFDYKSIISKMKSFLYK